jgi:hypothetical protein
MLGPMRFFAAAATSPSFLDRLREIPLDVWTKLGLGVLAIIVVVVVLRKLAKMNKFILGFLVLLALTFVGFNWIYERNEPAWATPFVQAIAGFFPAKPGK